MAGAESVFAHLIDRPEEPVAAATPLAAPPEAGKLLGWIQNNWKGSTIRSRDIQRLGPRPVRGRDNTLKMTEILVRRGYLVPMPVHRYDVKMWQITL